MASRWNEETTMKFVENYLSHECLWNHKHSDYRVKQKKQAAINQIVLSMGIPNFGFKDAEVKIRNIRSTYSQELKKWKDSTKSGAGTEEVKLPNLKWFNLLYEALKTVNIAEPRKTQNNDKTEVYCPEERNETPAADPTDGSETESQKFVTPLLSKSTKKRRLKDLQMIVEKVGDVAKTMNAASENEFDCFGKSVASQLQAMPLPLALQAQQHIQNYISQLRLQNLNYGHSPTPSPIQTPSPSASYHRSPSPLLSSLPFYPSTISSEISVTNDILAEAISSISN